MNNKINGKPAIKDIAAEADVAISTVSHVLNNRDIVSEKTRNKVLGAIKKLDYRPSVLARGLRTKHTNTIGIIVPDIADPYYGQVIKGMEEIASNRGYTLVFGCAYYNPEEEMRQIDLFVDHTVDGLIFLCGYDQYENIKKIRGENIPLVLVDRQINDPDIPSVLVDNALAIENAVDYLYKLGHRKIGYLTFSYEGQTTVKERYEGYLKGLKKNGLKYNPDFVVIDDSIKLNEIKGTKELIENFFSNKKLPTAFISFSDIPAIGLIKALDIMGYRVPEDISVMGYANISLCEYVKPTLTTIKHPKKALGRISMDLLLDIVEKRKIKNKRVILPTELVVRDSTAHPGQKV
jgi:LacI family transcriptional regulator